MLFIPPSRQVFDDPALEGNCYLESHGARTYSEYNYLGGGLSARVKLRHFEVSLCLCREWFGAASVLDFGCADGVFLPSLAHYFPQVAGVDIRPDFIRVAQVLAERLDLRNVRLVCNANMSHEELAELLGQTYDLAFMLEVLEHVGTPGRPAAEIYEEKMSLVAQVMSLLGADGRVVVSVPRMTGPAFLAQRAGLAALGLRREPLSFGELLQAGLLRRTKSLEQRWRGNHLGFNERTFRRLLAERFRLLRSRSTFFQDIHMIAAK